jgi:hypothetical protein
MSGPIQGVLLRAIAQIEECRKNWPQEKKPVKVFVGHDVKRYGEGKLQP